MKNAEKKYQFEIRCEAAEIGPTLKSIISKIKKEVEDSEELLFKFELAAREMLANAIEHGCALAVSNGKNFDNLNEEKHQFFNKIILSELNDRNEEGQYRHIDIKI